MIKIDGKILSWCSNPEEGAIQQARNLTKLPCLIGNVCLMPDTHQGYGMPIGGVIALDNAICPNAIGKDIGCGMLAVKTTLATIPSRDKLNKIVENIKSKIPVGSAWHDKDEIIPLYLQEKKDNTIICAQEYNNIKRQLGTLGSGNHFIEIQYGDDGHIWYMIHSGSRNLGRKVADYYNDKAEELCLRWFYKDIVDLDLAFIPQGDYFYDLYWNEMQFCLDFARSNRNYMAVRIFQAIQEQIPEIGICSLTDIHHNYAALEHHYGKDVIVHRKGATLAEQGVIGIIPGSQGTCSYIVEGLGKESSLCSCSHGAGRKMSRSEAKRSLDLEETKAMMESLGIINGIKTVDDLDEAPGAYKDIDIVISEESDLVKPIVKLKPLAVIKG